MPSTLNKMRLKARRVQKFKVAEDQQLVSTDSALCERPCSYIHTFVCLFIPSSIDASIHSCTGSIGPWVFQLSSVTEALRNALAACECKSYDVSGHLTNIHQWFWITLTIDRITRSCMHHMPVKCGYMLANSQDGTSSLGAAPACASC